MISDFVREIEARKLNAHGILVYRHGRPAGEYHWVDDQPRNLYSLSKSFLSTGIGIAVEEGLLSLEDKVLDILPEYAPPNPGAYLQALTLHDLLIMASGHDKSYLLSAQRDALSTRDWIAYYLAQPLEHAPGSKFVYDTGNTYLASAMLQKAAGETAWSYLQPRLFQPLGIAPPRWDACPKGITLGGAGLWLTLNDTIKLGQLYLDGGLWQGRRIVSEKWIALATQKHIETHEGTPEHDGHYGYGYQFWRGQHNSYRGDGAYGQFCVVIPEADAVVAIHAREYSDTMGILQVVWDALLPALNQE